MGTGRATRTALTAAALIFTTLIANRSHAADAAATTTPTTAATSAVSTTMSNRTERRLVVSIPDRKLAVIENDAVVTVYPIAVGAARTPSPVGTFTIVSRVTNPTYYKRGKTVAPGATNPVGTRWIGLSQKGYGIHGTNQPRSIGFAKSHGCIRLRNEDVERLFERVRSGDVVELHAERPSELAHIFSNEAQ
jgi:lipoprotein-anchoring transpeptidase ErfK/SrfK